MNARMVVLALCLGLATAMVETTTRAEVQHPRESLAAFPLQIEQWRGRPGPDFDKKIVDELGVDDYVNVVYTASTPDQVGLYIGYYASQRQGDTIHSPANCLPGGGWEPVEARQLVVPAGPDGSTIAINRWLIQKADEQQIVLYWYQSHGRVVASEYWAKFYLVVDSLRLNRTDGALVRVITPIDTGKPRAVEQAERRAVSFVSAVFPLLARFLPV